MGPMRETALTSRIGTRRAARILRKVRDVVSATLNHLDPQNVLKRGYSITLANGKAVKSVDDVQPGDLIKTLVADGTLESNFLSSKKKS